MAEDWGTDNIYADPYPGDSYNPEIPNTGSSGYRGARDTYANGGNFFPAANRGDTLGAMSQVFEGLKPLSPDAVKANLKGHARIHRVASLMYSQPAQGSPSVKIDDPQGTESLYDQMAPLSNAPPETIESAPYDFFGTALMPIAGIYYWLWGEGKTRTINIGSLNLSMVPGDFTPVTSLVNNPANGPGTYQINQDFQYNAFSQPINLFAAGLIGRVIMNLKGDLTINGDGSYSFNGSFTIYPDRFDANHSNRSYMQEALTDFLRYLGDTYGHNDYQINIDGSLPVQINGHR
ncbi:lipid II-degrading bacteriocin [Pseudomonas oryzihabitans]|uniref:lipid II-degrading bacteriocin n=1 Tax=Pseudomonas oryzihabitans TaxID=47885 RepID=UPI00285F941B|nr:lipid II-degrading bacteriocin [Pseudomonas psychrotolerans]MDR6680210.1 hypothetical protein [Pseudomonas psychrotolerans]